jgi:hypothetical protein
MAQTINNFKDNFFGGTRTNRFRITGTFPYGGAFTQYHVSAADLPQAILIPQTFDYRGRKLILPGDRIYGQQPGGTSWTVTVLDDTGDNTIWKNLHNWSNRINNHELNTGTQDEPFSYKRSGWTVEQLDLNCTNVLKKVTLYGCWPSAVGAVELNMTKVDQYVTFDTTFVFDYIDVDV